MRRVHVLISGQVQGVFFRSFTQAKAQELGLAGWVKNLDNGQVEAVFEGEPEKVEKMINWCYKGPPASQVKKVETSEEMPEKMTEFEVKR